MQIFTILLHIYIYELIYSLISTNSKQVGNSYHILDSTPMHNCNHTYQITSDD